MTQPIEVDIPHKLGRAVAKERIGSSFGRLAEFVPGGAVTQHHWEGDRLDFTVEGLGQRVGVKLDVGESNVHAVFELPQFLAMFADQIRAKLQREAPKLLE
ncbi:polyhydroxyalkanoic acid system family protein [Sphingomonas sp.]|jgi:hypothetical protein|uniref:polyhydroxyalkanoic acid system family protein n=1 Tax=Sphingomonas sp. TaxID=28214 RepID=UPI0035C7AECF